MIKNRRGPLSIRDGLLTNALDMMMLMMAMLWRALVHQVIIVNCCQFRKNELKNTNQIVENKILQQ
jgi:hypothetical protein